MGEILLTAIVIAIWIGVAVYCWWTHNTRLEDNDTPTL